MNRQDEINKAAGQVLRDRMQENYFKIFAYYSDHKEEILSDLTQQISCMINQAKNTTRNTRQTTDTICRGKLFA